jgi:hypothetical protein
MLRTLACVLLLSSLHAQEPPKVHAGLQAAKSWLPDDHKNYVSVDFAALRKTEVWDDLEASLLSAVFKMAEQELGFPLAGLDRLTMVGVTGRQGRRVADVVVFEGNRALPVALRWSAAERSETEGVVVHQSAGSQKMLVQPRPELQVVGSDVLLIPVLQGKPHRGMPAPDVMSLLSGRLSPLVSLVVNVGDPAMGLALQRLLPDSQWPDDDAPQFLAMCLQAVGDPDDLHLRVEARLRHGKAGAGLEVSKTAAKQWLAQLRDDPRLRAARGVIETAQFEVEATDLVLRADLGRVRQAVGTVATLALPLFPTGTRASVQVVEPPPPPPPPLPPAGGK